MVVFIWGFAVATIWAYIIHEARKRRKEEEIPDVLKCALYDYKIEEVQPDNSENEIITCHFDESDCKSCRFCKFDIGEFVYCEGSLCGIWWSFLCYPRLNCNRASYK